MMVFAVSGCSPKTDTLDLLGEGIKKVSLDPVTLTFYFIANNGDEEAMRDVLDEVEKKAAKALNVKLNFIFIPHYIYRDTLKRLIAQGDPCDMFAYNNEGSVDFLEEAYEKGFALDITDLFPKYAPSYYSRLDDYKLAVHRRHGRLFAVPNNFTQINMMCAIVRDDLMQKHNIPPIKNLDDFDVYLDTVNKKEDILVTLAVYDTLLGLFASGFGYVVFDYVLGLVYRWDDPEMKIIPWEQTPEFPRTVERVHNWIRKGYFLKDTFFLQPYDDLIAKGRIAAVMGYQLQALRFNTVLFEAGVDWRYVEYPLFPDSISLRYSYNIEGMAVSAHSEHPERAMMFVEWLHGNQDHYDLLRYGIKKKHYLLKGDQYYFPEGVTIKDAFLNWQRTIFLDMDFERTHVSASRTYRDEVIAAFERTSRYPPHGAFRPVYPENLMAGRRIVLGEFEHYMRGERYNSDSIENYIREQKKQGIDKLVVEVQSQLDEWRKGNNENK